MTTENNTPAEKSLHAGLIGEVLMPVKELLGLLDWMPEDRQIPVCAFADTLRVVLETADHRAKFYSELLERSALSIGIGNLMKQEKEA